MEKMEGKKNLKHTLRKQKTLIGLSIHRKSFVTRELAGARITEARNAAEVFL